MLRVRMLLVVVGVPFVMAAVGCNEQKLKEQVAKLEGDKRLLDQNNQSLQQQLAAAKNENQTLSASLVAAQKDLETERAKPARVVEVPGPSKGGKGPVDGDVAGWVTGSYGHKMTISGNLLFQPGSATLTTEGKAKLTKVAHDLKGHFAGRMVRVYGFTDSDPIVKTKKLWEDNLDLSANRAMAVVRFLWTQGISKEKIETVAMGDAHAAPGPKANSRRVEIFVVRR